MNDIRKQRLMRELVGGEEGEAMPPAAGFLRIAGIAMMLFALFFAGGDPT